MKQTQADYFLGGGGGDLPHECENHYKNIEGVQISALQTCVVNDINEDILLTSQKQCCSMLCAEGFKQVVTKPTRDSGTLIDHVYVSNSLHVDSDVSDCYYSDHDHVLCAFNI